MNILIIGSGGREFTIAMLLSQSEKVKTVFWSNSTSTPPPYPKIQKIQISETSKLLQFSIQNNVSLLVPGFFDFTLGPEIFLVEGIADVFRQHNIKVFGPSQKAAIIEGSKLYSKLFMNRYNIPTAKFNSFSNFDEAKSFITNNYKGGDFVIKCDGLASGKGVFLPDSCEEAFDTLHDILNLKSFKKSGDVVVIEERLFGQEVSVLVLTDSFDYVILPAAQDHKRIGEGDVGLNTGGMGAYAPAPIYTKQIHSEFISKILEPTLRGLRTDATPFVGCLYAGLILTNNGPHVIEYNCRFGDPETQVCLPLAVASGLDLLHALEASASGCLASVDVPIDLWRGGTSGKAAAAVVIASKGYPESSSSGDIISLGNFEEDVIVIHSGTDTINGNLITNGGRVLAISCIENDLKTAIEKATRNASFVSFDGMQYRRDIGYRYHVFIPRALDYLRNKSKQEITYADAGVSIDAGNSLVDKIKSVVKATRRPGTEAEIGGFGGVFDLSAAGFGTTSNFLNPEDTILVSGTDGVGTKLKIAQIMNNHSTIGIDLVAMSVNDVLVQGAEPLFFLDYFACSKLDVEIAHQVVSGISAGCIQSACALIGGETAEMPGMYSNNDYDLAGFVVGAVKRKSLLPCISKINPDTDVILGLLSSGIHSNGYSLVRHIISSNGIDYNSPCPWNESRQIGDELLVPTRIYVKALLPVIRKGLVKAMSHITGGGFTENIPRCLPYNVGCIIDASKWELPPVFKWLKTMGNISNAELSRTFNCGIGMILVVAAEYVDDVIKLVEQSGEGPVIAMGTLAKVKSKERVKIVGDEKW